MKKKASSPLGYIIDYLNIPTNVLAAAIHVDSSLVSKWKSGSRVLSPRSIYYRDVIDYLLNYGNDQEELKAALRNFYPKYQNIDQGQIQQLLCHAISSIKEIPANSSVSDEFSGTSNFYIGDDGKLTAIRTILDYAEGMPFSGEFVFVESDDFSWLLDDEAFAAEFMKRFMLLVKNGFKVRFIIHYTSYKSQFVQFFLTCSNLIFNRNVKWFYYDDYSKNMLNTSIILVNKAISLTNIASSDGQFSSSILCNDPSVILQHERMVDSLVPNSHSLFHSFELTEMGMVIDDLQQFRKRGAFYCLLSAPAFITAPEEIIREILRYNRISDDMSEKVFEVSRKAKSVTKNYFVEDSPSNDVFVFIFHLEKLLRRAENPPFISRSLSLICHREIVVPPEYYAARLRALATALDRYSNLQIVLATPKSNAVFPATNIWCRQNTWMLQMDKKGFRISDELGIVNAVSTYIEKCVRSLPPIYREKRSVKQYLLELANKVETSTS